METFLLTTKLYIPLPHSNLVKRPRLTKRLDEGMRLGRRLTLISASAGSGKTTLLSEWIHTSRTHRGEPLQVAWLSLDEDDNDPAHFWAYVIAALQTIYPKVGQSMLPMLQGPQLPPVRSILTPLLNELAALSEFIILILDDYHLITAGTIHDGVAFLLDHLPRQLHLVIATRADPPLPIARLRARGQLTELRADDLRFTTEEVAAFLNEVMGLNLQPRDIAALEVRTEGWISGLHLAALSIQGREDVHAFVEAFTGGHQYIIEYLIEEVLSQQPEPVQRFLLQTSIRDRLCAPLCDALTGEGDGAETLERLQRDNLFTIPLDDEGLWYRYHHLFGDLLRKRLGQAPPFIPPASGGDRGGGVDELHRRASQWHEENSLLDQAVKHARAAGDFERIAQIAERAAGASLLDARLTALLRWVDTLPQDVLRAHPRLQIYRAWALYMNGHLEAAQQALRNCRQALKALPPSAENDSLRRMLIRLLDIIEMIAQGFMYDVDDKIEEAIRACSLARDMALEDGHVFLSAQATEGLALAQYYQGHLRASAQSCQQVIDLAVQGAAQAPLAAAGYVELAGVHIEWNDLDKAADLLDEALALCREWGILQTLNEAYTAQSHLLQLKRDIDGAWEALEKAREFSSMEGDSSLVNFRLSTQEARLNLAAGEPEKVVRWVKETRAAFVPGDQGRQRLPTTFIVTLHTILARACLAQDEAEEALAALEPLQAPAEAAGAFLHVIEVCALKALALQALGDTAAALISLERSLALAKPEGFMRVYLNEGAPMASLLREAAARGIQAEYVDQLLAAFGVREYGSMEETTPTLPHPHTQPLTDSLTSRELDVLHCISQGLSNKDIAEKLVIALNTVKRHTSSIYGKLDVKSRTQAVARARELGLLPTDQN
ncbi:MAG: LuxR family transcriptional regulator [Anaerolineae bacterium]|nr:LuxR family transcriptional regulator [Anaerolineae bacterium]